MTSQGPKSVSCAEQYLPKGGDVKALRAVTVAACGSALLAELLLVLTCSFLFFSHHHSQGLLLNFHAILPSLPFTAAGTVFLCQLKNESLKLIHLEVGDQLSTPTLWSHSIEEVLKELPHFVFEIWESILCKKVCLTAWETDRRFYELISTPDQTKDLFSLRLVSAEKYGIFQFVSTEIWWHP